MTTWTTTPGCAIPCGPVYYKIMTTMRRDIGGELLVRMIAFEGGDDNVPKQKGYVKNKNNKKSKVCAIQWDGNGSNRLICPEYVPIDPFERTTNSKKG